jgi:hypothetical protein
MGKPEKGNQFRRERIGDFPSSLETGYYSLDISWRKGTFE